MKTIVQFDKWLFNQINQRWTFHVFDGIMPFVRDPLFWVPFYLFMLVLVIMNFPRKAFYWILSAAITVTLTDSISSRIFKPLIGRLRPCNDPELMNRIRLLADHCGQNGSFTSSHAANHFGMAMFFSLTLKPWIGNKAGLFFGWAALVSYAQVYVGVHFPFDVLGGALLGMSIGWMTSKLFHQKTGGLS